MGGGWWRVSYATTTADSTNEYGVEVQVSKTVYIDGVQLEEKNNTPLSATALWEQTIHGVEPKITALHRERLQYYDIQTRFPHPKGQWRSGLNQLNGLAQAAITNSLLVLLVVKVGVVFHGPEFFRFMTMRQTTLIPILFLLL